MLKFISWNVNGLRACYDKGFVDVFHRLEADFFCLQETKMQEGQLDAKFEGYHSYWNYAEKKGYSGTAIFSKVKPLSVTYGLGIEEHDHEGRVITLELESFYLITVYTPNSQEELRRLDYRMKWEDDFRAYLKKLEEKKYQVVLTRNSQSLETMEEQISENDPGAAQTVSNCCFPEDRTVVAISSAAMGNGNDELGHTLMKGFLYALSQLEKLPEKILFYNGGVTWTTEGSDSLEDLKTMEEQGVEILSCGTCLNFYGLTDKLKVGSVTNMYDIVESMAKADKVIHP